ncbi:hypothetical protein OG742_30820 [Streptomyces sp. NBC_00828]|uniref:hypothetical protein n=1 Tax=Streptomyces sp. NBC_00828 TaxID=2903678 RepID=UPI00386A28DD
MTPPPALQPAFENALAVLVGTATHVHPSELPAVPQAARSVLALHDALAAPQGSFAYPAGLRTVVDPRDADEVVDALVRPRDDVPPDRREPDVLLFYYAGHGFANADERQLRLALPATLSTRRGDGPSLPIGEVFAAMAASGARQCVAVLDCCFAGLALHAPEAARVHLLTAASEGYQAGFLDGRPDLPTAFTGVLLDLLHTGVPDEGRHLDLGTLYRRLAVILPASDPPRPDPTQRAVDDSADLALAVNPAHGTAHTRTGLCCRRDFALLARTAARRAADFDDRSRAAIHLTQAVHEARALTADATAALGRTDPDTLYYRELLGVLLGESGDSESARAVLTELASDLEADPDHAERLASVRARLARRITEEPSNPGRRDRLPLE